MSNPSSAVNHKLLGAAAVSCLLLAPLGVFGGSALAHGGGPSAAEYQYNKVTVCHRTHSKKHPWHMITIGRSALPAHLRHGDMTPPPCPATPAAGHEHGKPAWASSGANTRPGSHDDGDKNGNGSSGHGPKGHDDDGDHGK